MAEAEAVSRVAEAEAVSRVVEAKAVSRVARAEAVIREADAEAVRQQQIHYRSPPLTPRVSPLGKDTDDLPIATTCARATARVHGRVRGSEIIHVEL